MQSIYKSLRLFLVLVLIVAAGWVVVTQYSYIFAKDVKGEVIEVERVSHPTAIIGGSNLTAEQQFSMAVLIRAFDGEMFNASSIDRQWAIARRGSCVQARFDPYPPWNFEKAGTFFNARLIRVFDCKREAPATWQPTIGVQSSPPQQAAPAQPQEAPPQPLNQPPPAPTPVPAAK